MSKKENPLVSIIVITYNSSRYVLETLESAKAQTYQNIELIISDDASQDNTVDICGDWLDKNSERFVRTELITAEKNTGIPANCNRGLKAAKGEWVKLIAGDDLLAENCIEVFIQTTLKVKKCYFFVSSIKYIGEKNGVKHYDKKLNSLSVDEILRKVCELRGKGVNLAVSAFYNREVFNAIGGFDSTIRSIEDIPTTIRVLSSGYRIYIINDTLVKYRILTNSVSGNQTSFKKQIREMVNKVVFPKCREKWWILCYIKIFYRYNLLK